MATKTLFLTGNNITVVGFGTWGELSETDPGASTTASGWTVAKTASGNFRALVVTAEVSGFSTTDYLVTTHPNPQVDGVSRGDSFRSLNTYNGTFANANWTFTCAVRAVSGAGTQRGRIKARIWKSANADGSSPTELTAATLTGSIIAGISTTVDNTTSITWSPGGTVTLTNEYLFVQCEWEITTAGDNNNRDILLRASASTVVTSDFTPAAQNLTPSLVDSDDNFFAPTVTTTYDIAPSLFSDADDFFAPTFSQAAGAQDIAPSLFADDGEAFFAPTVSPGTVDVAPSLYDDTDNFFAPTVSPGAVNIAPSLYDDTEAFFAPTVSGTVNLSPSLYDDVDAFFAPTVAPGAVNLSPSLYDDVDTFFAPTVAQEGSQDISPSLYSDADSFFAPTVSATYDITPSLYSDADQFLAPTVDLAGGAQTITPSLFDDTDTFFAPTVTAGAVNIAPSLFDDIDTFFAPTVSESGAQVIAPSLFTDDDAFFTPAFIADQSISPTLFADDDVFFVPDISGGTGPRASTLAGTTRRNAQSNKERRNVSTASRGTPAIKER